MMIELKKITKIYENGNTSQSALKNVDLLITEPKFISIVGDSGSGKTTLLNIIGTLIKPTNGELIIDGENILLKSDDELAIYKNKKIGFIFQQFLLDQELTALQNIVIPQIILGVDKIAREDNAVKLLEKLNILEKKDVKVKKLSGGEQQRVCIARALINDPDIILADEPTGALDIKNSRIIFEELKKISQSNKMVIMVTHNIDAAMMYSDEVVTLKDGEVYEIQRLH